MGIKNINELFGPIVLCLNFVFCLEKYFPARAIQLTLEPSLYEVAFLFPTSSHGVLGIFMLSKIKSFKKLNEFFLKCKNSYAT